MDMKPQSTELELINKIISGETRLFRELIVKYQQKVMSLCYSMVGPANAEDAAQEVFIKVFQSLAQFKGNSAFSTWLYRITANHCLNIIAKTKRERTESLEAIVERAGENIPALTGKISQTLQFESRETVQAIFKKMSVDEKTILALREITGLNYRELADTLDISMDLVKVRLFRARQSFISIAKKIM